MLEISSALHYHIVHVVLMSGNREKPIRVYYLVMCDHTCNFAMLKIALCFNKSRDFKDYIDTIIIIIIIIHELNVVI